MLRKVKCDETKPSCLRCKDGGRSCGGYPPIPPRAKRKDAGKPRGKHRIATEPMDYLDDVNTGNGSSSSSGASVGNDGELNHLPDQIPQRELGILTHFRETVAACFRSTFDRLFWGELLLQIGAAEPAVLYALDAMTQVFLHAERGLGGQGAGDAFALGLQQYNRAIQELQRRCSENCHDSEAIFLLCSLIFSHIEALAERRRLALLHLQRGIQLLQSRLGKDSFPPTPDPGEAAAKAIVTATARSAAGEGAAEAEGEEEDETERTEPIMGNGLIREFILPLFRRKAVSAVAQGYASPALCLTGNALLLSPTEAAAPFTTFSDASKAIDITSGVTLAACAQACRQDLLALQADNAGMDGADGDSQKLGVAATAVVGTMARSVPGKVTEEVSVAAAATNTRTGADSQLPVTAAAPAMSQVDWKELAQVIDHCSRNFTSFESLALASMSGGETHDMFSLDSLRIYLLLSHIMSLRVSEGTEKAYDVALPQFSQLFELLMGALPNFHVAECPHSPADAGSEVGFRFQPGRLFPLWFIATKCRHRPLRLATLAVIKRWTQREEGWDPALTARAARCVIEEEDASAFEGKTSGEYLPPEQDRVHASRFESTETSGGNSDLVVFMTKAACCSDGRSWALVCRHC